MIRYNHIDTLCQATRCLTLLLLLALLLTACVSDENLDGRAAGRAIAFGTTTAGGTRAVGGEAAETRAVGGEAGGTRAVGAEAAALLDNRFVVYGEKVVGGVSKSVFPGYEVAYTDGTAETTESNTRGWEYVGRTSPDGEEQEIKYWDLSATRYDYFAYSLGAGDATGTRATVDVTAGSPLFAKMTLSGSAEQLATCYLAEKHMTPDGTVPVTFRFAGVTSRIRVGLYETVPGYSVRDVRFYTSDAVKGNAEAVIYANADMAMDPAVVTVTFDAEGRMQTDCEAQGDGLGRTVNLGQLKGYVSNMVDEEAVTEYVGRSSATATLSAYRVVMPLDVAGNIRMKVDYTLVSTDGSGQTIHVEGATAIVPAEYAQWKANYLYTYMFKISECTNGYTGGTSQPAGLYPVTFDAYSAGNDLSGEQGTVTTASAYSITTYQEGSANDESVAYEPNYAIDLTVIKGDGTQTEKVTLVEKPATPVAGKTYDYVRVILQTSHKEEDVETSYPEGREQTVTVTDGKAQFTPPADGYYRVEYWYKNEYTSDAPEKRAVKIVKVGDAAGTGNIPATTTLWDQSYRHVKEIGAES